MNYTVHYIFQIFPDYSGLLWQKQQLLILYLDSCHKRPEQFLILYLDSCHKRPEQGVMHWFEIPTL